MTRASDLFALQEVDSALDAAKAALADIESRLGESEELANARQSEDECKLALFRLQEEQRSQESEIDTLRKKIEEIDRKLYGGTVHSVKELEGLQQDEDMLKRRQASLEDRDLEIMEAVEAAVRGYDAAKASLAEAERVWAADQERLAQERVQREGEIAALEKQVERRRQLVSAVDLKLYDGIRSRRQGRGVARAERGMCQGCRISLPMHVLNRLRSSAELVQCGSCERILYLS